MHDQAWKAELQALGALRCLSRDLTGSVVGAMGMDLCGERLDLG